MVSSHVNNPKLGIGWQRKKKKIVSQIYLFVFFFQFKNRSTVGWNFVPKQSRVRLSRWNATPKRRYVSGISSVNKPLRPQSSRKSEREIFRFFLKELRRRFRYLRHLPLSCEFAICELDLKPPVLSLETLNHFKGKNTLPRV